MAARKLQTEIDRTLKKVTEGVEAFSNLFEKISISTSQPQKDKLETDLKSQIKKLQRLRDQIKSWIAGGDVKDKAILLEYRKLIETQMERFKACEKEMKTKQFSKERLSQSAKLDPQERLRADTSHWISSQVDLLAQQVEATEAELEVLALAGRKKKSGSGSAANAGEERVAELERLNDRRNWHIGRLELMMRLLENWQLNADKVVAVQEDIAYFVESNMEEDFEEDEAIYDELNLKDDEGVFGLDDDTYSNSHADADRDDDIDDDNASNSQHASHHSSHPPTQAPPPVPASTLPTKSARRNTSDSNSKPDFAPTAILKPPPPPPVPASLPQKPQTATSSASTAAASTAAITAAAAKMTILPSANSAANKPGVLPQTRAPITLPPIRYSAAAAAAVTPTPSALPTPATATPQLQIQHRERPDEREREKTITASTGNEQERSDNQHNSPAAKSASANSQNSQDATSVTAPLIVPSPPPGFTNHLTPALSSSSTQQQQQQQQKPQQQSDAYGSTKAQQPNAVRSALPAALADLGTAFEAAKQNASLNVENIPRLHQVLESASRSIPEPRDTDKPKYYVPRNPAPTPTYYPQLPTRSLENPLVYSRFDLDTLFYIFYYMQGTYQQYLAARELKKQSWRFHKQYLTWFQRHAEPTAITEEYEQGVYIYFDWEGSWSQRKKRDFRFEYTHLEDSLN